MEEKPDLQQKNAVPGIFPYKVTDAVKKARTATYLREKITKEKKGNEKNPVRPHSAEYTDLLCRK